MAALIGTYSGYVALSFLPTLVWLLFWLREDRHPEPKHILLLAFIGGMFAALGSLVLEIALLGAPTPRAPGMPCGLLCWLAPSLLAVNAVVFLGVAFIEEYLKYLSVKFTALKRREFDEPVDAMVYMVTAAMGFAAIENVMFLVPVFEESFRLGRDLTVNRFLGANLLHALASAIVGYALARHAFSPYRRHAIAAGVLGATLLHALFNFFIIRKYDVPEALYLLVLLLSIAAIVVIVDFERLKKRGAAADAPAKPSPQ